MADYFDLVSPQGTDTPSGFNQTVWWAPLSHFASIADVVDADADTVDAVTITGTHTFNVGKGFVTLYTTMEKTQFSAENGGEPDNEIVMPNFEFFYPGNAKEAAVFARRVKNERGILLFETINDEIMQIGKARRGARVSCAYQNDPVGEGSNGWTFTAMDFDNHLRFYEGTITLKP